MKNLQKLVGLLFNNYVFILSILFVFNSPVLSQENVDIGSLGLVRNISGSFYDFSESGKLNIRVAVWGYVKNPGKYIIPMNSNAADLLSYAGGLLTDAFFDDLRIYRMMPDSTYTLVRFGYDDLFWKSELSKENKLRIPQLIAGDIIAVPGQPRTYFRDWFALGLAFVSTLISLSILIFK